METSEIALDSMVEELTITLDTNEDQSKKQSYLTKMYGLSKSITYDTATWTMSDLIDKLDIKYPTPVLDLEPSYQRMDVWPELKRKEFLNNLFLGCAINDIILALYKIDEHGNKYYRVIDGKQRLTSILRFVEDTIKVDIKDSIYFPWYNKSYKDLRSSMSTRNMFEGVGIQVKIYDTTSINEQDGFDWESWTFTQMNSSISLNNIEKRNAQSNELNTELKKIYQGLKVPDRIYTKSISDNDRYKNKEMIEKVFYQAVNKDWFSKKMTAAEMMKFQENFDDSELVKTISRNFYFIHNIMVSNNNLNEVYWKIDTKKNNTQVWKKTGIVAPLNNLDLLVYGMSLIEDDTLINVKEKFTILVSIFYKYMEIYKNNKSSLNPIHKAQIESFIEAGSRGTSTSGPRRKEYLDYLYTNEVPKFITKKEEVVEQ
jgi:hypothetical protein